MGILPGIVVIAGVVIFFMLVWACLEFPRRGR